MVVLLYLSMYAVHVHSSSSYSSFLLFFFENAPFQRIDSGMKAEDHEVIVRKCCCVAIFHEYSNCE